MGELKITSTGDKFAATLFHKIAREYMFSLKHSMVKPGNPHLNLQQCKLERRPYPGVVISCHSFFGIDTVNIHVEPGSQVAGGLQPKFRIIEEFFWYAFNLPSVDGVKILEHSYGNDISVDSIGNSVVVGAFPTTASLSSLEPSIMKYNSDGKLLWRKLVYASNYEEYAQGVDIDPLTGNIVMVFGLANYARVQCYDCALVKYSGQGILEWKRLVTFPIYFDADIRSRSLSENGLCVMYGVA